MNKKSISYHFIILYLHLPHQLGIGEGYRWFGCLQLMGLSLIIPVLILDLLLEQFIQYCCLDFFILFSVNLCHVHVYCTVQGSFWYSKCMLLLFFYFVFTIDWFLGFIISHILLISYGTRVVMDFSMKFLMVFSCQGIKLHIHQLLQI